MSEFAKRIGLVVDELLPWPGGRVGFAAVEVGDGDAGVIGFDADRPVRAASTIKVPLLMAALRAVDAGKVALGQQVELPALESRVEGSGVLKELSSVDSVSFADILTLMIIVSDNTATNLAIDLVGFDAVASLAADLGCTATRLERKMFDTGAEADGRRNETSARDQVLVLAALAGSTVVSAESRAFALDVLGRQHVRDRLPALLPESATCLNKTGDLNGIRHDVGLITAASGRTAAVAVLVDEITDPHSRETFAGGPGRDFIATMGLRVCDALG